MICNMCSRCLIFIQSPPGVSWIEFKLADLKIKLGILRGYYPNMYLLWNQYCSELVLEKNDAKRPQNKSHLSSKRPCSVVLWWVVSWKYCINKIPFQGNLVGMGFQHDIILSVMGACHSQPRFPKILDILNLKLLGKMIPVWQAFSNWLSFQPPSRYQPLLVSRCGSFMKG